MAILDVLNTSSQEVNSVCIDVPLPGLYIKDKILNLYQTMYANKGVGLAANQIGWKIKLAVMDVDGIKLTLINPIIIEKSEETVVSVESCLSCPDISRTITRHKTIKIRNFDLQGTPEDIELTGNASIVAQHEIDHLYGIHIVSKI